MLKGQPYSKTEIEPFQPEQEYNYYVKSSVFLLGVQGSGNPKQLNNLSPQATNTIKQYIANKKLPQSVYVKPIINQISKLLKDYENDKLDSYISILETQDHEPIILHKSDYLPHPTLLYSSATTETLKQYLPYFYVEHNTLFDLKEISPVKHNFTTADRLISLGTRKPQHKRTFLQPKQTIYQPLPYPEYIKHTMECYPYRAYSTPFSSIIDLYMSQVFTPNINIQCTTTENLYIFLDITKNHIIYILSKIPLTIEQVNQEVKANNLKFERELEELDPETTTTALNFEYDFEYTESILQPKNRRLKEYYKKYQANKIPEVQFHYYTDPKEISEQLKSLSALKQQWRQEYRERGYTAEEKLIEEFDFTSNYYDYIIDDNIRNLVGLLLVATYNNEPVAFVTSTYCSSKYIYHTEATSIRTEAPALAKIIILKEFEYWHKKLGSDVRFSTGISYGHLTEFKMSLKPTRLFRFVNLSHKQYEDKNEKEQKTN